MESTVTAPAATDKPSYEYTTFPRQFVSYKWYKPLLVAILAFVFMLVFQIVLLIIAAQWAGSFNFIVNLGVGYDDMSPYTGPEALALIGGVATMLPALALAALIVRDRPYSSYSSSRGGWNWKAFGKCMVVALVVTGIPLIVQIFFFPDETGSGVIAFTVVGALACLVLVPIQCVAEEYVFRGLVMQAVGSWTRLPVFGIIVSAAVFAAGHPYNMIGVITIFCNGIIWGVVVWQTRGLEATSATHIVNNLVAFGAGGLGLSGTTSEIDIASLILTLLIDGAYAAIVIIAGRKYNWFASQGDGAAKFNEKKIAKMVKRQELVLVPGGPVPPVSMNQQVAPPQGMQWQAYPMDQLQQQIQWQPQPMPQQWQSQPANQPPISPQQWQPQPTGQAQQWQPQPYAQQPIQGQPMGQSQQWQPQPASQSPIPTQQWQPQPNGQQPAQPQPTPQPQQWQPQQADQPQSPQQWQPQPAGQQPASTQYWQGQIQGQPFAQPPVQVAAQPPTSPQE